MAHAPVRRVARSVPVQLLCKAMKNKGINFVFEGGQMPPGRNLPIGHGRFCPARTSDQPGKIIGPGIATCPDREFTFAVRRKSRNAEKQHKYRV